VVRPASRLAKRSFFFHGDRRDQLDVQLGVVAGLLDALLQLIAPVTPVVKK
jgi:hypothetical protein